MAVELTRSVDPSVRARLEALAEVNLAGAQALATQYNRGTIDQVALDSRIRQYNQVTASDSGVAFNRAAARFGNVVPIRSESPSREALAAIGMMAGLDISNPEGRPGVIQAITLAIA